MDANGNHAQAGQDHRHAAEPVGQAARDRREPEHPERMATDHQPDRREIVAVIGHVERGHRHDQHHHDLTSHERHDGDGHARARDDARQRDRDGAVAALHVVARRGVGKLVWVGSEQHERQQCRSTDEHDRHQVWAAQLGQSEGQRDLAGRRNEVRSGDGADGGAPHDEPDRRRPPIRWGEVGRGVARQLVRGVPETDQHGPDRAGSGATASRPRRSRRSPRAR